MTEKFDEPVLSFWLDPEEAIMVLVAMLRKGGVPETLNLADAVKWAIDTWTPEEVSKAKLWSNNPALKLRSVLGNPEKLQGLRDDIGFVISRYLRFRDEPPGMEARMQPIQGEVYSLLGQFDRDALIEIFGRLGIQVKV